MTLRIYLSLSNRKIEHPSVEPQVQDAETIEIETKKEDSEFFDLKTKIQCDGQCCN